MISINTIFNRSQNLIAYRITRTECYPVKIVSDLDVTVYTPIKNYSLVLPSGGYVKIEGIGYVQIDEPGLYRIYRQNDAACIQWIVNDGDLITFAASVAAIFYHSANEPKELTSNTMESRRELHAYFLKNAPAGKVGGVCITAANTFAFLCQDAGIDAVFWEFQDITTAYNPVKSHVMTEIRYPNSGKRILVDIDRKFILHNELGQPLNCMEYIQQSISGGPVEIVPISNAKIAGFGPTERLPMVLDFEEELMELADDGYRKEIVQTIGKSLLIKGTRYYDNYSVFTLPGLPARIREFLSVTPAEAITERERIFCESVLQYPEAEF